MILALMACAGAPTTPTANTDRSTEVHTGATPEDTAPDGGYVDAAAFAVRASFGWDASSEQLRMTADHDLGWQPMEIDVVLLDTDAITSGTPDERNSCTVRLLFEDPMPVAGWVEEHGGWIGLDAPPGATVVDGCRFYGVPGVFSGDVGAAVSRFTWGASVGPLQDGVREALLAELGKAGWAGLEPYAVGAAVRSDALTGLDDGWSPGFAVGFEVTANFEREVDAVGIPVPMLATTIAGVDGPPTGYYELSLGTFAPGDLLAQ
ncbi:MAG: hypothetical protein H6735_27240 [Alphaproteobacteria bacterium]|nr:hypothetical protein [Alphaproteobacteria bacterium]